MVSHSIAVSIHFISDVVLFLSFFFKCRHVWLLATPLLDSIASCAFAPCICLWEFETLEYSAPREEFGKDNAADYVTDLQPERRQEASMSGVHDRNINMRGEGLVRWRWLPHAALRGQLLVGRTSLIHLFHERRPPELLENLELD